MAPPASAVVTSSVFGMWFKRLKYVRSSHYGICAKLCSLVIAWANGMECAGRNLRPPSCSLSLETAQAFDCALPFLFGTDVPDSVCRAESQAGRGTVPCTSWVAVVDFGTG